MRQATKYAKLFLFAEPMARYFEGVSYQLRGRSKRALQAWRAGIEACGLRSARYIEMRTHDALAAALRRTPDGRRHDERAAALAAELGCERTPAFLRAPSAG